MTTQRSALLSPLFLISLALLLANDHVFKELFHNELTGKLSDLAGMVVLPVFILSIYSRLKPWAAVITAVFFIWWKSPLSQGAIELFNALPNFKLQRVVDYSDLFVLALLPFVHRWLQHSFNGNEGPSSAYLYTIGQKFWPRSVIMLLCFFSLCSTSRSQSFAYNYCKNPGGSIVVDERIRLKAPADSVLTIINSLGYEFDTDSIKNLEKGYYCLNNPYYILRNVIVPSKDSFGRTTCRDTIQELHFNVYPINEKKSQVVIHKLVLSDETSSPNWKTLKSYSKEYGRASKQLIEAGILEE